MEKNLISISEIERLAEMSALHFDAAGKERMIGEVGGIISMLDQCGEIKTEGNCASRKVALQDLREDVFESGLDSESVLINAPNRDGNYFVISEVDNGV